MQLLWFTYLYPIPVFHFSFLNIQHDKNSIMPQKSDQQLAFIPRGREREGTFLNLKLSRTWCPLAVWLRVILKFNNCMRNGRFYILLYFWVSKTLYKSSNEKNKLPNHDTSVQSTIAALFPYLFSCLIGFPYS